MPTPQLKAVIFDLDGVLVSTSKFHAQAWEALVRSEGYEPPADLEDRVRGISRMASLKIALGEHAVKYSEAELDALAAKKNAHYLDATKNISPADLYPGALALFNDLRKHGIKIVLGSASKNARPILDGMEVTHYFDAIADGHAYTFGKPHPDVFLCGARMVGATPEECIVVEDAPAGVNAALDGGFVAVGLGNAVALQHAHLNVDSLEGLNATVLRELLTHYATPTWTIADATVTPPAMPFGLTLTLDGQPLTLEEETQQLDLRSGIYQTCWTGHTATGATLTVLRRAFIDAALPGRLGAQYQLESRDATGLLTATITPLADAIASEPLGPQGLTSRLCVNGQEQCGHNHLCVLDHPTTAYCLHVEGAPAVSAAVPLAANSLVYLDHMAVIGDEHASTKLTMPFAEARVASTGAWHAFWQTVEIADTDDVTALRQARAAAFRERQSTELVKR